MVKCLGCIVEELRNLEVEFSTYYKRNLKKLLTGFRNKSIIKIYKRWQI